MSHPVRSAVRNRLLRLLSPEAFEIVAAKLHAVDLPRGRVLAEPDAPIRHVYFIEDGLASIVAISQDGVEVEAGVFGRDGAGPLALALGSDSTPNRVNMQLPGRGWRVGGADFLWLMETQEGLRELVLRYGHVLSIQMSYTSLANATQSIDARLARWLLMCDDRSESSELPLTHEFMSLMLAVRRSSVTTSLHVLEGEGLIQSERGRVIIRNRSGLEAFAGAGYGAPEAEYRRLIGSMSSLAD